MDQRYTEPLCPTFTTSFESVIISKQKLKRQRTDANVKNDTWNRSDEDLKAATIKMPPKIRAIKENINNLLKLASNF